MKTILPLLLPALAFAGGNTSAPPSGLPPLTDLGAGLFAGPAGNGPSFPGGLYPGGSNTLPTDHLASGQTNAALITPRDANGNPAANGKIGVLCIGMSNASQAFSVLVELLGNQLPSNVVLVNGASGPYDIAYWADGTRTDPNDPAGPPASAAWVHANTSLAGRCTAAQIQLILAYDCMAHSRPGYAPQPWPATPQDVQALAEQTSRAARTFFPKARVAFWGTREYGGYSTSANNPEPYAHGTGFGIKWMIEKQIVEQQNGGASTLAFDDTAGVAPWLAWGPYTWADGLTPRADGMVWESRDCQTDGTHPSRRGQVKLGAAWARFLRTNPLITNWFNPAGNLRPAVAMISPFKNQTVLTGPEIVLEALAEDHDGSITRVDFFSGTTLLGSDTTAPYSLRWTHPGPGSYTFKATAVDNLGATFTSTPVTATLQAAPPPPAQPLKSISTENFESSDLFGGGGWPTQNWNTTGTVTVTNTPSPAEGSWQARVSGGATLWRDVDLSGQTQATVSFLWRAGVTGATFTAEIFDGTWHTLHSVTNTTVTAVNTTTVALDTLGVSLGAGMSLRFSVTGGGTAFALVDDIHLLVPDTSPPATLALSSAPPANNLWQLTWPAVSGRVYSVEQSVDLANWSEVFATQAEEDGTLAWSGTPPVSGLLCYRIREDSP